MCGWNASTQSTWFAHEMEDYCRTQEQRWRKPGYSTPIPTTPQHLAALCCRCERKSTCGSIHKDRHLSRFLSSTGLAAGVALTEMAAAVDKPAAPSTTHKTKTKDAVELVGVERLSVPSLPIPVGTRIARVLLPVRGGGPEGHCNSTVYLCLDVCESDGRVSHAAEKLRRG
jgi:hypothetical protein